MESAELWWVLCFKYGGHLGFIEGIIFEQKDMKMRKLACALWGKTFQPEGVGIAKALRLGSVWGV
jgi:hypothetical protein